MLEAERAGAKALVVFMDEHARNGEAWKVLRAVQADETHNCALIGRLLEKSGTPYSHATGEFYDKALAVREPRERIAFLIKGLNWALREFENALPRIGREDVRSLFEGMHRRHRRSIAACQSLLENKQA